MIFMWAVIFLLILIPLAIAGASFAPWSPTKTEDIERVKDVLQPKKGQRFLEFGCGDGRVCHGIASAYPDLEVVGIEMAFPLYIVSKIRQFIHPLPNLSIELWSGFKADFSEFDMIYMYGMPDSIAKKILPKFEKEAKTGTQLISYVFSFKDTQRDVISHSLKNRRTIHILTK